jgi:hypothetical protein
LQEGVNPLAGKAEHYAWKATDIRLLDRPADDDYIPKVLLHARRKMAPLGLVGFFASSCPAVASLFVCLCAHTNMLTRARPTCADRVDALCSRCCLFLCFASAAGHVKVYAIRACADVSGT